MSALKNISRLALAATAAALLAGCHSDEQEVREWMAKTKAEAKVSVKPLTEPKTFVPYAYNARDSIAPFDANKLLAELARANKSSTAFKPDMERRKELLESFPLDTIKMVGTMQKGGVVYALLQIDKNVYQVRNGQHMGQNYGLVTKVDEDEVNIKEIVQDAVGDWVERMTKLELQVQENTK